MERIKELIYAACMCAVINSAAKLLSPEKMQKEIRTVCTLMLLLCMAAQMSGGFRIKLSDSIHGEKERYDSFSENVLEETENSLEERLEARLKELGLENVRTGIDCTFDEYNYVKAERVTMILPQTASDTDIETAAGAAAELFPGAETEVTAGDRKGGQAAFG